MVKRYLCVLLFFVFFNAYSDAVLVDGNSAKVSLVGKVLYFEDTTHKLTFRDIQQSGFQKNFRILKSESIPYGKHPIWFTFSLENRSDQEYVLNLGLVGTLLIDLYKIDDRGKVKVVNTGIMRPYENKEEKVNFFLFNVDDTKTFIGRIETWDLSFIPIQVLLKADKQREANLYNIFNGIYVGVVLLVCVFCLYYFILFKEMVYLSYIGWAFGTSIFMFYINGIMNEFFAQKLLYINTLYPLSLVFSTIFYFLFIIVFLQLKKYSKIFYWIFVGLTVVQFVIFALYFIGYNIFTITQFLGSVINLLVLVVSIVVYRKGHKPGLYLFVATWVVFFGGLISVLAINNIIPLTPLTSNALQFSLIVEVFLFIFGLVEKSFKLRKETIATQAQIIEVMHQNERIIHENAYNLEREVRERTKEVEEQNIELRQQHEEMKLMSERIHEQNELLDGQNSELKNYNEKLEERVLERTDQLKRSSEKLLEHNKKLEQYSYITSHNLRGPIARILGLYNILDKNQLKGTENEVITHHMYTTAMAMDSVIKDMAKILEINNKKNDDYSEFDINELFEATKQTLNVQFVDEMSLTSDFNEVSMVISVKPYIQSIFYNLLSNSIKYRFPFRPLEVKVRSYLTEEFVVIEFSDNGLGIDIKSVEQKIFQPFQRFHEGKIDGSGFGLFLVKLQLDNLGGKISISSEPNVGTTISIFLPLEQSVSMD